MQPHTENVREFYTDVFLSHNWGKDSVNHEKVFLINEKLIDMGYETWFDEQKLWGCMDEKMEQGIKRSKGVIVFLTHEYHEKVNSKNDGDNCKKEFLYASHTKTRSKMVPVVMEKCMRNPSSWKGLFDFNLCREKYVDMSGNLKDNLYLSQQMEVLKKELQSKGIYPGQGMLCSYFFFQCYNRENYAS